MKKLSKILCLAWLMMLSTSMIANNITVSNVSLEGQVIVDHYCLVDFNIYWNNSWRTSSIPQNWDAAWVFVKYSVAGGEWQHATLDPSGSVIPASSTIDFVTGGTGVFIYRDSDGNGTFSLSDVGLRWNYGDDGVADDASVEIKVFAIEMVYVPQGSFYLGDGGAVNTFYQANVTTQPFLVDGTSITFSFSAPNLYATGGGGSGMQPYPVPSTYPTGYDAFYCMKYEISQEQYVDFLNTLTRDQQNARTQSDVSTDVIGSTYEFVMSGLGIVSSRNGISCPLSGLGTTDPITFHCNYNDTPPENESGDGQNIACNFIKWGDVAAYGDWAGLRPMTESEFEKACRGPNSSILGEYAWGNTNAHASDYNLTNAGFANESISDMGLNTGNMITGITDNIIGGPVRCGIFAASSTNNTRVETGSSYYGIMELSGNLSELAVCMFNWAGLSFTGLHGDGVLNSVGHADTDYWPGINGNFDYDAVNTTYSTGVTGNAGVGQRGGFFGTFAGNQVSDRAVAGSIGNTTLLRTSENGGRLVRTAP